MPVHAWLFDLDGTLVDTAPDLAGAANALRIQRKLPPLPVAHYRAQASAGARGLIERGLGVTPEDAEFQNLRSQFLAHYAEHLADNSQVFEGFQPILKWFQTHRIPWGIVTNKPKRYTDALCRALGLDLRAHMIVSADEVPAAKPAPDALIEACRRAGLEPSSCAYVGDDLRDIQAGQAAGMSTVAAEWGYIGSTPAEHWYATHRCATVNAFFDLVQAQISKN